jgi:hypothetical protein
MSSLTTTTINTLNSTTNLTLQTGNTNAAKIIVGAGVEGVAIGGNSTTNVVIANSTALNVNVNSTFTKNVSITGTATISTNTLNLGLSSISVTGYSRLPNGLLFQWGSQTGITFTAGTITFPVAFASAPFTITLQGTHANTGSTLVVTGLSTTTATVRTTNTVTAQTGYWMAIGV